MAKDPTTRINGDHELVLPVPESAFADFVTKLLGKPQTIEALFQGPFDLTVKDIENCFHIVNHRVNQQNSATLVQFIVRVEYEDNSSVVCRLYRIVFRRAIFCAYDMGRGPSTCFT